MADFSMTPLLNLQGEERKRKADGHQDAQQPPDATGPKRRQLGPFDDDEDDDMDAMNDVDIGGYFLAPSTNPATAKSSLMEEVRDDQDELEAMNEAHGSGYFFEDQSDKSVHKPKPKPAAQNTYVPPDLTGISASIPKPSEPPRHRPLPSVKYSIRSCSGKVHCVSERKPNQQISYEQLIAARSTVSNPRRARKSYYGIPIHDLLDTVAAQEKANVALGSKPRIHQSVEPTPITNGNDSHGGTSSLLWTEKYRAKRFVDLIGDDRTHRSVLRWLKGWDKIVLPGLTKSNASTNKTMSFMDRQRGTPQSHAQWDEREQKKILLLTGPPGLGKTTLAHVCARQAGYEVMEINASDERGRNVVKHRIRDAIGTENVKTVSGTHSNKPICVVVDEVDGVVGGSSSGGGEGGFVKALVDLVHLDRRNSTNVESRSEKRKKRDKFRLLRPIILICNDLYHPTLRPLRSSFLAEIVHARPAPIDKVVNRMKHVFQQESVPFDTDGIRKLCEATWGIGGVRERTMNSRGMGEGDIRGVLVAGQWVGSKLKSAASLGDSKAKLSKKWVEAQLKASSKDMQGLGRGGVREIVERVFLEGAGFPSSKVVGNPSSKSHATSIDAGDASAAIGNTRRQHAMEGLQQMIEASGDHDRCMNDCFSVYPTYTFQDDTFLTKPRAAYEWLQFHDEISSKVFSNQAWELGGYLSQPVLAFHHLFSSSRPNNTHAHQKNNNNEEVIENEHPFSGVRADFAAFEARKQTHAIINEFQTSLPPHLLRTFRSKEVITTELIPFLMRMLAPDVKPVVVENAKGGSASVRREGERALVRSAVGVMQDFNIKFSKTRVERDDPVRPDGDWVFRMEPPLDTLIAYSNVDDDITSSTRVRYAVRQLLAQEHAKEMLRQASDPDSAHITDPTSRSLKKKTSKDEDRDDEKTDPASNGPMVKRDFFGRIVKADALSTNKNAPGKEGSQKTQRDGQPRSQNHAWVSYREGFSNAVRKRITLGELLDGFT